MSRSSSASKMTTTAATSTATTAAAAPLHASFGAASPDLEYFDVLTADGVATGQKKLRREVHRDGDWHRSVHIWIVRHGTTQILVQKRAASKDSFPSCWDVSCAGHLSAGETSWAAAIAELREELGVHVADDPAVSPLRFIASLKREMISQQGRFIDREWTDVYVCHVSHALDQYVLQADEVEAVEYIEIDTFLQRLTQEVPDYVPFVDLTDYSTIVFDAIRKEMGVETSSSVRVATPSM